MIKDYYLIEKKIYTSSDIYNLSEYLNSIKLKNNFIDEIVLNINCPKELYDELIDEVKKIYFGTNILLPKINMYINNIDDISLLSNMIEDFITPIKYFQSIDEISIEEIENLIDINEKKYFSTIISIKISNSHEYKKSVLLYDKIKSYFFNKEITILYDFCDVYNTEDLLYEIFKNINYIKDTLDFLGYRQNIIISTIKKYLREKQTSINQNYNKDEQVIINLIKNNNLNVNIYTNSQNDLVRKSMDDFGCI